MNADRRGRSQDPSRVLVACALKAEADLLSELLGMGDWELAATGLGVERTRQSLTRLFAERRPRLLVFAGTAGGLDPALASGDVVVPQSWRLQGGGLVLPDARIVDSLQRKGWSLQEAGYTALAPVLDAGQRRQIFRDSNCGVCDMEAAAALQTAARFGLPAIAVKVVTDPFQESDTAMSTKEFKKVLPRVMPALAESLRRLLEDLGEI